MISAGKLRTTFLDFFKSKSHEIVESDSLVPQRDPTLLFTSAGMNQFKDQFIGKNVTFKRATTCQKCLRTLDLDNVGKTNYHHTFFEMLGNFSFGDYFKEEAIQWAWEFLLDELKFKEDNLWVSVYHDDQKAYDVWFKQVHIPEKKIVRLGDKDNFWPANAKIDGPNGPCGPCSEIFFDWGKSVGCGKDDCNPSCGCGRFVEIWNLVFTQFNRTGVNILEPLLNKNIDTGMGFERLFAVMEGVKSNFETSLFKPITSAITENIKKDNFDKSNIFAIADHIRAATFAIGDGVIPSNEQRGYVIRKLIRKAAMHARTLGIESPFLYKMVYYVTETMKDGYPYLLSIREDIASVIKAEEDFFLKVVDLDRALSLYENKFEELFKTNQDISAISAQAVFFLSDTYGIPKDIGLQIAEEKNHIRDSAKWNYVFNNAKQEVKNKSRQKDGMQDSIFTESWEQEILHSAPKTEFIGYSSVSAQTKVCAIFKDGKLVDQAKVNEKVAVVLERTPFYGESGGQSGDKGILRSEDSKTIFSVEDTQNIEGVIVHIGFIKSGQLNKNDIIIAKIDEEKREAVKRAHSATHLLQAALRKVLGTHVKQTGSLVGEDYLRFDFTHTAKTSLLELQKTEDIVNNIIQDNSVVSVEENIDLADAQKKGAIALFGNKYGAKVRMVSMDVFSKELCGGTHVDNTGSIKLFKITGESAIAAGTRRIEALTSNEAIDWMKNSLIADINELTLGIEKIKEATRSTQVDLDKQYSDFLNSCEIFCKEEYLKITSKDSMILTYWREKKEKLSEYCERLKDTKKKIDKAVEHKIVENSSVELENIFKKAVSCGSSKIIIQEFHELNPKILRHMADEIKLKLNSGVIVFLNETEGKLQLSCTLSNDLIKKGVSAGQIVEKIAKSTGLRGGGGRPDFAQAGGTIKGTIGQIKNDINTIIKELVK